MSSSVPPPEPPKTDRMVRMDPPVIFGDTTLRDGEQMPGVALRLEQKVTIAKALVASGVFSIEAGFPAVGPAEVAAVRAVAEAVPATMVTALCRTVRRDIDAAAEAFDGIHRKRCGVNLFIATSPVHRRSKLKKNESEVLQAIVDAVAYAKEHFHVVTFGAEDASRTEFPFLCKVFEEALAAGATTIGYPDTLGILLPDQTREIIQRLRQQVAGLDKAYLGVHFHNDLGMAVANTVAAVQAGAAIVQCTVGGLGERAGNAALEAVAVALHLHKDYIHRTVPIRLETLAELTALVARETGVPIACNTPVVGGNVFATEAGIHQDGLLKDPDTYLPYRPELVGVDGIRLVLGKHSGRAAFEERLRRLGLSPSEEQVDAVTAAVKASDDWTDSEAALRAVARSVGLATA